jgi:hypothetical protein
MTIYINASRHGSLQNAMADQTRSLTPEVGMGATEVLYSDRHPYTVTRILSAKRITVKPDEATRIDKNGCSEDQQYAYVTRQDYPEITLFLNKRGRWKRLGDADGATYLLGRREEYYDFTR